MLALLFSVMPLVAVSLLNNRLASTLPPLVFFVHPLLFFSIHFGGSVCVVLSFFNYISYQVFFPSIHPRPGVLSSCDNRSELHSSVFILTLG